MADVSTDNGYTMIANELLEEIQNYKFTLNQYKIIMVIWRYTYGFKRKEHKFSLGFLEKATHLTRSRVSESLQSLIQSKVIHQVQKGGFNHQSKVLAFNKNYDDWMIGKYSNSKSITSVQNATSVQDDTRTSLQNDTRTSVQNATQEIKDKEIKKENINVPFVEIISYLNEKADKRFSPKSSAHKKLISGRFIEGRTLEDFKHVIDIKCQQWLNNPDMNKYLRPGTLFSPMNFENYLNEQPKQQQQRQVNHQIDTRDIDIAFIQWCTDGNDPEEFDFKTGKGKTK